MRFLLLTALIGLSACTKRSDQEIQERKRQAARRDEIRSEFAPSEVKLTSNWYRFENKEVICYEANNSGVWCYRKEQQ